MSGGGDEFIELLRLFEEIQDKMGTSRMVRDAARKLARSKGYSEEMIFFAWVGAKTARPAG